MCKCDVWRDHLVQYGVVWCCRLNLEDEITNATGIQTFGGASFGQRMAAAASRGAGAGDRPAQPASANAVNIVLFTQSFCPNPQNIVDIFLYTHFYTRLRDHTAWQAHRAAHHP